MKNETLPDLAVLSMMSDLMKCLVQDFRQKICIELFGGEAKVHKNVEQSRFLMIDSWFSLKMSDPRWRSET